MPIIQLECIKSKQEIATVPPLKLFNLVLRVSLPNRRIGMSTSILFQYYNFRYYNLGNAILHKTLFAMSFTLKPILVAWIVHILRCIVYITKEDINSVSDMISTHLLFVSFFCYLSLIFQRTFFILALSNV